MMRATLGIVSVALLGLLGACVDAPELVEPAMRLESQAPKANLHLKDAASSLTHTSQRPWTLSKTGTVDPTASTVTWAINATQGPAGARRLVVTGNLTLRNTGGVAAPVGNIVVRLQTKSGSTWTTRSVDVADATLGDAATYARVVTGSTVTTISENTASGALSVPLVPQLTIGANSSVPLAFTAAFDNDILGIAAGTTVRAEIIVTFGNAGPGNTPANIDINGSGVIDASEARVDGASVTLGDKVVPAAATTTTAVTLSDTFADISTTPGVTISNPVFNIGATSGTVQVTYDGGDAGGTIQNCAHLTGTGISLEACSTQIIAPEPFEWTAGDVVTFRQGDWGDAAILGTSTPFSTVYPLGLRVGTLGVANQFSLLLSTGPSTQAYLPTAGANVALAQSWVDPPFVVGGLFSGELVGLRLNVDFGAAGLIGGLFDLGDLYLCNLTTPTSVSGSTVAGFIATANTVFGGGSVAGVTRDDAADLAGLINSAFLAGAPSTFADNHLSPTPCPP